MTLHGTGAFRCGLAAAVLTLVALAGQFGLAAEPLMPTQPANGNVCELFTAADDPFALPLLFRPKRSAGVSPLPASCNLESGHPLPTGKLILGQSSTADWIAALRRRPMRELVDAPEKGAPILAEAIQDAKASDWVLHMLDFAEGDRLWTIPVYAAGLKSESSFTRWQALTALGKFGPEVRRKVPNIAQLLAQMREKHQDQTSELLQLVDKLNLPADESLPLLSSVHRSVGKHPLQRSSRPDVMASLFRRGPGALPTVLDTLADADYHDLTWLPHQLDESWLKAIGEQLSSQNVVRRRIAALLLERQQLGGKSVKRDQLLIDLAAEHLGDPDAVVRGHLLDLLARQPVGRIADVPKLVACLDDEYGYNSYRAGSCLAKIGHECLPEIRRLADSQEPRVRRSVAALFGNMKPAPLSETPLLIRLCHDADASVRCYAIYSLSKMGSATPEVVETLTTALAEPGASGWAAPALGRIGPAAAPALESLHAKLKSASPLDRISLAQCIWQIEPTAPVVLPTLIECLSNLEVANRGYGVNTKFVAGEFIEECYDLTAPIACYAAEALGEMGPDAAPAVADLMKAVNSENSELSRGAVVALGKIGPKAREATPLLVERVKSNTNAATTAMTALRSIAPEMATQLGPNRIPAATGAYRLVPTP